LEAAAALIAELGWGRVTTRAVAERAGLPHGAVSYHFQGKQALLSEAALDLVERSFPLKELRAAGSLAEVVSQMRAWAGGPAPVDLLGRAVLLEAMREAGRDLMVRARLAGLLAEYRQVLADLVRAAQHRGHAPAGVDPAALAALLAAAGDGLLLHAMLEPEVDLAGAVEALGGLLHHTGPAGGARQRGRVAGARGGRR
jgi:AcrR family transcriptional regulator